MQNTGWNRATCIRGITGKEILNHIHCRVHHRVHCRVHQRVHCCVRHNKHRANSFWTLFSFLGRLLLHFAQNPLLHCPVFSQIHLCSIAGVPQFLQPSLCWEGSILSKLILDDLKGSSAKNKQTMNAKMVTGPPRIGEGPGFDSQGNVISLRNTAFPTCIKSIGSYWVSYSATNSNIPSSERTREDRALSQWTVGRLSEPYKV